MRRREFITLLGGMATSWPLTARAQQKLPVIGFANFQPEVSGDILTAIRRGLAENGYVEGRDFAFEYRWANYQPDRMAANLADLVQHGVTAILALNTSAALAAKAASQSTPTLFMMGADPVATGLIASLHRPGGNLTGVVVLDLDIIGKCLEILHELVPAATQIAYLSNPTNKAFADAQTKAIQLAADALGIQLSVLKVNPTNSIEIEGAFAKAVQAHAGALVLGADPAFFTGRKKLTALAAREAMPTIYQARQFVEAGGLVSYGTHYADGFHLLGVYAGRILKGEKPSDLPVQQITKTELVINLKTAKTLGLTIPPTLLARADEVIE
jgi:putative tryptophan/tyrosine transport system substrate-binding protein